jgi:hypothetical protein
MRQVTKSGSASVAPGAGTIGPSVARQSTATVPTHGNGKATAAGAPTARMNEPKSSTPGREEIARRAYEIYLSRSGRAGSPEGDWLQAERELSSRAVSGSEDAI